MVKVDTRDACRLYVIFKSSERLLLLLLLPLLPDLSWVSSPEQTSTNLTHGYYPSSDIFVKLIFYIITTIIYYPTVDAFQTYLYIPVVTIILPHKVILDSLFSVNLYHNSYWSIHLMVPVYNLQTSLSLKTLLFAFFFCL